MSEKDGRKLGMVSAKEVQQDLVFLGRLLEEVKIRAVIDKVYPLDQSAEALRYLGTGHARAKVVIRVV
jgi:NADPH:quinone reductase-like Zn-dependent oxidoreductase